jgi:hypothetical protein
MGRIVAVLAGAVFTLAVVAVVARTSYASTFGLNKVA